MAIADRINEMYNHVGDAYDILELAGTNLSNLFNENVEQGAIGSYVGNTYENSKEDSATRIRTVNLIQLDKTKSYTISVKSGYSFAIFTFNDEKKYYDGGHAIWSSNEITITNIPYIALSFKKSSEANIVPSEIDDIQVMLNEGTIALPYAKSVDKNLINLAPTWKERLLYFMNNGTQQVWDNWEKVTGSGTELSLSPTLEAPMKNVLNGNTYQFTTTGKNLLENTFQSQTANGITFTRNDDGSLTFSGTATQAHSITGRFTNDMIFRAGVTYIFSLGNKQAGYGVYLQKTGNVNVWYLGVSATNSSLTITPTEDTTIQQLAIHFPNGNTVNGTIYPMVRLSSVTDSTYEPYTGGQASPNPQYPQDVHVVSGDNTIKVEGRNLLNANFDTNTSNGITQNGYNNVITLNGANTSAHGYTFPESITFEKGVAYTTHVKIIGGTFTPYKSGSNWAVQFYSLYGSNAITLTSNNYNSVFHFTPSETSKVFPRLWFGWESASVQGTDGVFNNLKIQVDVVKGTYTTSQMENIEPYNRNIYSINLPIENLFDDSTTTNVLIADDGTEQTNNNIKTSTYIKVEPNTLYTCSSKLLPDKTSGWLKFSYYNASKNYLSYLYTDNTIRTITTPNNCEYIRIGYHTSIVNDVQFEKGSKANSYTPYGTTPIELCNFNTYKDNFLRTSGKNLFDSSITSENYYYDNNGEKVYQSGVEYINQEINNVNYTSITISFLSNTGGSSVRVCEYNLSGAFITRTLVNTNNQVVNLNNATTKIILSVNSDSNSYFTYLMIEKGSSATSYEPYGSGEWYKYEPINKIVLDSSSYDGRGDLATANTYRYYFKAPNALVVSNTREVVPLYSNLGLPVDRETAYVGNNGISYFSQANKMQFVFDETKSLSIDDLKDWLDNHYFEVYYLLDTPNYIKITYEPLLEQLEAFYNAKSKNSQTNITQESNDMPFELDVVALSK